jgi:hypothetical protein
MRGRAINPITVKEAGRKGGMRTSETHGHDFYEEIGHKGGLKGGPKVRSLIEAGKKAMSGG